MALDPTCLVPTPSLAAILGLARAGSVHVTRSGFRPLTTPPPPILARNVRMTELVPTRRGKLPKGVSRCRKVDTIQLKYYTYTI